MTTAISPESSRTKADNHSQRSASYGGETAASRTNAVGGLTLKLPQETANNGPRSPKKESTKIENVEVVALSNKMSQEEIDAFIEKIPEGRLSMQVNPEVLADHPGLVLTLKKKNICSRIVEVTYSAPSTRDSENKINHQNLASLIQECQNLTRLNFSACKKLEAATLVKLFAPLMAGTPKNNLAHIDLSGCEKLTNSHLRQIFRLLPDKAELLSVNFTGCLGCTDEGFLYFLKLRTKKLETLNLSRCQITDFMLQELPNTVNKHLKGLMLHACKAITRRGLCELGKHLGSSLTCLDIGECDFLTDTDEQMNPVEKKELVNALASLLNDISKRQEDPKPIVAELPPQPAGAKVQAVAMQSLGSKSVLPPHLPLIPPQNISPPELPAQTEAHRAPSPRAAAAAVRRAAGAAKPNIEDIKKPHASTEAAKSTVCLEIGATFIQGNEKRPSVLTLAPAPSRSPDFEETLKKFANSTVLHLALRFDVKTLEILDEKTRKLLGSHLKAVNDLIYSSTSDALTPLAAKNLNLLAREFNIKRLSLARCTKLSIEERATLIREFPHLLELNLSEIKVNLAEAESIFKICPKLDICLAEFEFTKPELDRAEPALLIRLMQMDAKGQLSNCAEDILQCYLNKTPSLDRSSKVLCIRFALLNTLYPLFQQLVEIKADGSPCILEADSITELKLSLSQGDQEAPVWNAIEDVLKMLNESGSFSGTVTLRINEGASKAGSKSAEWVERVTSLLGKKLIQPISEPQSIAPAPMIREPELPIPVPDPETHVSAPEPAVQMPAIQTQINPEVLPIPQPIPVSPMKDRTRLQEPPIENAKPSIPVSAVKHKETSNRTVLDFTAEVIQSPNFKKLVQNLQHGERKFALVVSDASLQALTDDHLETLQDLSIDKLIYSPQSEPLSPSGKERLGALLTKFSGLASLSLAKCTRLSLKERADIVDAFYGLNELNVSHLAMDLKEVVSLLQSNPALTVLHGSFSFTRAELESANEVILLDLMLLEKLKISPQCAQDILECYLAKQSSFDADNRVICVRWALRFFLADHFKRCVEVLPFLTAQTPERVVLTLSEPKSQEEAAIQNEVQKLLRALLQEKLFVGSVSVIVEGENGNATDKNSFANRMIAFLGGRIDHFRISSRMDEDHNYYLATPYVNLLCRCPSLESIELQNLHLSRDDLKKLFQACKQMSAIWVDQCVLSDFACAEINKSFKNIKTLRVSNCSGLTPTGCGHLQEVKATERVEVQRPLQTQTEALKDWTTQELIEFINNEPGIELEQVCMQILTSRQDITLSQLAKLLPLSAKYKEHFSVFCEMVNDFCKGWFHFDSKANTGSLTANANVSSALPREQIEDLQEICRYYISRKAVFTFVAFPCHVSKKKTVLHLLTYLEDNTQAATFNMLGSEDCMDYLERCANVRQVTYLQCGITNNDLLSTRKKCHALEKIELQQCAEISLVGVAKSMHYQGKAIEVDSGEVDRLDDTLIELTNAELIELVRLLSKLGKMSLLRYVFEMLPIVPDRFTDLWSEAREIPEVRTCCMEAFNAAFKGWVEWKDVNSLRFMPHEAMDARSENFNHLLSCLKGLAATKQTFQVTLDHPNALPFDPSSLDTIFEKIGLSVHALVLNGMRTANNQQIVGRSLRYCYNIQSLTISSSDIATSELRRYCAGELTSLRFVNCPSIDSNGMQRLVQEWKSSLTSLSVNGNHNLDDQSLWKIVENASITHLDVTECTRLTDEILVLLTRCPYLETLIMKGCQNIALKPKNGFVDAFKALRVLNLAECPQVNEGLADFAKYAPHLVSLNLDRNSHVKKETFSALAKFNRLQELSLMRCDQLTPDAVEQIPNCWEEGLTTLNLENCAKLRQMDESTLLRLAYGKSKYLTIHVRGYQNIPESLARILSTVKNRDVDVLPVGKYLTNESLNMLMILYPAITTFAIEYSNHVQGPVFETALTHWEKLTSLKVVGEPIYNDESTNGIVHSAPYLNSLHLEVCDPLSDESLTKIASYGTQLRDLTLVGGTKFTDTGLSNLLQSCPNLEKLHLVDFKRITLKELSVTCTKIKSLSLKDCKGVTLDAIQSFVGQLPLLEALNIKGCSVTINGVIRFMLSFSMPENLREFHVDNPKALVATLTSLGIAPNRKLIRSLADS